MPMTVITLSKVKASLRGDLTKWMQEMAVGVYVGNFNSRIREKLWERIKDSIEDGEATMCYYSHTELGYNFETINTKRKVVDFDGISLVLIPEEKEDKDILILPRGFSNASKFRKARQFTTKRKDKEIYQYVVLDIETDGLDENQNSIIEIGAVKVRDEALDYFHSMLEYEGKLPKKIVELTGIDESMLQAEGKNLKDVLETFLEFVADSVIVGYNIDFDLRFLNQKLEDVGLKELKNSSIDLCSLVKKESRRQANYKLETTLHHFGIEVKTLHRALEDAKATYELSKKLNGFCEKLGKM